MMTATRIVIEPFGQLPPSDIEAEEALIAALMVDPDVVDKVTKIVAPSDFFREKNRWIFEAAMDLFGRGETINQVTVAHVLAGRNQLEEVGGQTFLAETIRRLPTSIGVEFYAKIVQRAAFHRATIHYASGLMQMAYSAPDDAEPLLRFAEDRAFELREMLARGEEPKEERLEFVGRLEEFMESPRVIRGVHLGWWWLDLAMDGLIPGRFITVGGVTGLGKSAFAQNVTRNLCRREDAEPVLLFSVEMSWEEVRWRLVFMQAGIDPQRARARGNFTTDERNAVRDAEEEVARWPLVIIPLGDPSLAQIRSEVRRFKAKHGGRVVIVDHLGFVSSGQNRGSLREEMVQITKGLKRLPGQEEVALIATSHVSRDGARSADWLRLGDLKESGSIENDSDQVLLLTPCHRRGCPCGFDGEAWAPLPKETQTFEVGHRSGEWQTRLGSAEHVARWGKVDVMVDLAKNRMGSTTRQPLLFDWWDAGGRFVQPRPPQEALPEGEGGE